jgi:FecR-like protein
MNLIATLLLLLFSFDAFAADIAAHVVSVKGQAWTQKINEPKKTLHSGDVIYVDGSVNTGANSSLKLLFTDQSKFDLGENTILVISEYQYKTANQTDSFSTQILKGTFRFVTGLIASDKPSAMEINLSVATIGIRGTHVVGETTATTAKVILLEPEKPASTAVEVFNQYGSVTIDKVGYGTEVPDQFSPPSPIRRMQMRTIDNLMRSIQNSQRIRMPSRPRI